MKKLVYVGFFILALSLNAKADSSDKTTQPVIASYIPVEAYIPGVMLQNNEERLSRGTVAFRGHLKSVYEIVKRGDGTCYKQTTHLNGMKEFASAVPGLVIRAPETTTVTEDVGCNGSTLEHVQ